jgi:hypothetical protein
MAELSVLKLSGDESRVDETVLCVRDSGAGLDFAYASPGCRSSGCTAI